MNLIPPDSIPVSSFHGQKVPLPKIKEIDTSSSSEIFEKFIFCIFNKLAARAIIALDSQVGAPDDFDTSYEPMELIAKSYKEKIIKLESLHK